MNRRIGLFPSKPGVHEISTAFDDDDDNSTDVITGAYGNSVHIQFIQTEFNPT